MAFGEPSPAPRRWLLATLVLVCASAAQAVASAAPLSLVGGTGARTITLSSCQTVGPQSSSVIEALDTGRCIASGAPAGAHSAPGDTQLVAIGQLQLGVRDTTRYPMTFDLRYVREDGHAARLPGCSSLVQLADEAGHAKTCAADLALADACSRAGVRSAKCPRSPDLGRVRVGAYSVATLPFRFALLSNESPHALQGTIYMQAYEQTTAVPVTATTRDMPDVQLESSVLKLSTNTLPILDLGSIEPLEVTVTGPGVGAMLAHTQQSERTIYLHDSSGNAARLELGRFQPVANRAVSEEPLQATAMLSVVGHPSPGTYSGSARLSELDATAPILKIQVRTHLPLWLAILCVFIGVVAANVVAPLALLRQRGTTLADALRKAVSNCRLAMQILHDSGYLVGERAVLWDLNDAITDLTADGDVGDVGLVSIAQRLLEKIEHERDDEDFDEDRASVLAVIARLSRWLRAAPAAVRLQQVIEASQQQMEAVGSSLTGKAVLHDTQLVQKRLMREPADPAATDDLVERVMRQAFWHRAFSSALAHTVKEPHDPAEQQLHAEVGQQLEALDARLESPGILQRTPEEQDALEIELEELRQKLGQPPRPRPPRLPGQEELEVNWQAPPSLFTGWAPLDAAGFHDLSVDALRRYRPERDFKGWVGKVFRDAALWGWSLFFTLVTSIVYALTIYNSTWGSTKDVLTALTAGFAGAVTLKIALPIFKSQRLRQAAPSPPL
jgi:hypothetical protein